MKTLTLAKDLRLPLLAVTESIAILAKRRAGKSTTARRLTEQLHRAGQQVVVTDPKGDWWGLRFARDGQSPGLPFIVLGGEHGDVPLEVGAGELVAKLVVEQRVSAILDLSRFRKGEVCRFMTAFMETLYRLKAQERYRTPLMLVIDEADAIAPQKPFGDEARMVGAASDLVRRGGQRGIGVTMLTQRSAVLSKDLLTQVGILIVLQTIAPQDRKAIDAWIDVHGEPDQRQMLMASLATLARGEGWVWAPGWPDEQGIFTRVQFQLPETFDSSKTPESGGAVVEVANAAAVDLDAFRQEMAATIEKAKADDPRELRSLLAQASRDAAASAKRINQLEERLSDTSGSGHSNEVAKPEVLTEKDRALLAGLADLLRATQAEQADVVAITLQHLREVIESSASAIVDRLLTQHQHRATIVAGKLEKAGLRRVLETLERVAAPASAEPMPARRVPPVLASPRIVPSRSIAVAPSAPSVGRDIALPPGERAVLTAALQYPTGLDRKRLGILTGYKRSSRDAYINRLSQKGLVEVHGPLLYPTDVGRATLDGAFEPLPTGAALVEYWRARLPEGERKTLDALLEQPCADVARDRIDQVTGYKRSSRDAYLTRLKARGLVDFVGRGTVRASEALLED